MGGLMSSKPPAPPPTPARPVTAVAKTPDLELDDTGLETEGQQLGQKKKGKKALKAGMQDPATQTGTGGAMAGVQVQK